ncbi:similar to Saccharomyces cerevisiae YDL004W ATP16 Delta subunit of the central stalk of mitochondrial F1F0 ATP synthase [Maudiozyma barnettii]|uniref:ATP synthase subunit delta, mitochondrial n=1 Tax=Maudiozyma barnettii TaxID=61262 RepID=A0A8H2ZKK2_9SACH|nr:F1F0 ATP synthase subunit delta [Kazachstania barnettii]CAB4255262.1 similar to Saccharomyces cerevisiae YDL004W ATP16 Delta subunit of the central stalk of mitochondrial F1F0 ATP synthase [Kazachstania barnettii]CAD1783669.1 similar to Saccharomyces cerevisiae YDL004W ATP16 Delta subunit of the central stalk of mitochondrial F1F0 ATP synthase [Kazachstania barnettii]
MLSRTIATARTLPRSINLISKRTYVEAVENALKLQFSLPHETLYSGVKVNQVNLPAQSGKMGILANHVPTIEQLSPGVVEILEENSNTAKKYFISGGFATVQPNSVLSITAAEAFPLESFSPEHIRTLLTEAKGKLADSDAVVAAEAAITVEVLEQLEAATK